MFKFLPEIGTIVFVAIYFSIYVVGIKKGQVKPVLATWLFLSLATFLSIVTNFRESGVSGLVANTYNIVDTFSVIIITVIILFREDTRFTFTIFEKYCLGAVTFVCLIWLLTGQNILAHLSIQVILVIAYLPTFSHLWKATQNTESLGTWGFNFVASIFGVVEPVRRLDLLPMVYGFRSILCTLAVSLLIVRIKIRERRVVV